MRSPGLASLARRAGLVLIAGLAFATVVPHGAYVFDDHVLIERNIDLRRPSVLWDSFGRDYYASSNRPGDSGYYRPITVLVNALDLNLWKQRTWGFHVTNLVLHVLACLALLGALRALGASEWTAWLAALLFAVHPAHAESVAFISGRPDVLAALFTLLAMICVASTARFAWLGVGLAAFLAFLSEESAVVLPVLVLLVWWSRTRRTAAARADDEAPRLPVAALAAVGVAVLAALALRFAAVGTLLPTSAQNARGAGALFLPFKALLFDSASLYAPQRLLALEPDPAHLRALRLLAGLLFGAALWAGAWIAAPRGRALLGLCLAAAGVSLLPVLNILPQETALSERFLYLPSAFLFVPAGVLVTAGWERGGARRWTGVAALVVVLAALAGLSAWRALAWRDDLRLWQRAVEEEPGRAAFWDRLGLALVEKHDYTRAEPALRRAVEIDPNYYNAQLNLGVLLHSTQRFKEAAVAYRKAIALQPRQVIAHLNLGTVYVDMRDGRNALQEFETVLHLKPDQPDALRMAGVTATVLGRLEEARRYLEAARRIIPGNPEVESAFLRLEHAEKVRAAHPVQKKSSE